jgi:hypothetical protein
MKNRHIRLRNFGELMTDKGTANYLGKKPSRVSRCPQQISNWSP